MDKDLAEDLAWILGGSQRLKIIKSLELPKTPKIIAKETDIKFSNISDNLKLMRKRKIVVCLTPENIKARLYQLTNKGKKLRKEILKIKA